MIICGARFPEDLDVLHGYDAVIIGVEASLQTRYERAKLTSKDSALSLEEFRLAEKAPTEGNIDFLLREKNFGIQNEGGLKDLLGKVDEVAQAIRG